MSSHSFIHNVSFFYATQAYTAQRKSKYFDQLFNNHINVSKVLISVGYFKRFNSSQISISLRVNGQFFEITPVWANFIFYL